MILSILIFIFAILVLCITGYKSKIIYPIIVKLVGIIFIMYSTLEYVIKLSKYYTTIGIENLLYLKLFNIKMNITDISIIGTVGVAVLMVSSLFFAGVLAHKKRTKIVALVIPIVVFTLFNLPTVGERLYLSFLDFGFNEEKIELIRRSIIILEGILILTYMAMPYFILWKRYKSTVLYETKKDMIASGGIWCFVDLAVLVMILFGRMYSYMFFSLNFSKYPISIVSLNNDAIMIISSVITTIVVVFITVSYLPLEKWGHSKDYNQLMLEKDENVFVLLHTYKNVFCSIMMYSNTENDEYSFLGADKNRLDIVKMIAEEQFEKLNNALNVFKTDKNGLTLKSKINIVDCVKKAIKKSNVDFELDINYSDENLCVRGDEYQIIECFVCLLNNACEAVSKKADKSIKLTVGKESDRIYFEIKDNGCGIEDKDLGKIFNPFYSTKKGADNYGLGLAYVKKVVNYHNGTISVKSKKDLFTVIQIILKEEK